MAAAVINKELTKFGAWQEAMVPFASGDARLIPRYQLETFHHVRDSAGRAIGGLVVVRQHVEWHGTWASKSGTPPTVTIHEDRWEVHIHSTRNGCTFGASRRPTICKTLAEAQKLAVKKLEEQRKYYVKTFGKEG